MPYVNPAKTCAGKTPRTKFPWGSLDVQSCETVANCPAPQMRFTLLLLSSKRPSSLCLAKAFSRKRKNLLPSIFMPSSSSYIAAPSASPLATLPGLFYLKKTVVFAHNRFQVPSIIVRPWIHVLRSVSSCFIAEISGTFVILQQFDAITWKEPHMIPLP